MAGKSRPLNSFLLASIFVSCILSIRNWPISAEMGVSSIFYILLAAVAFLAPVGLVSAELATGWPKKGGIYVWVKEAFGYRTGLASTWFVWISNVVWYPTILSFIGASVAYLFAPSLVENKFFVFFMVTSIFWGMILVNLRGTKTSSWLSTICLILGTIIPGIVIIYFGIEWFASGQESQMNLSARQIIPSFSGWGNLVFFSGILLGFSGMEMPAVHANEVVNPQRSYPRAVFLSLIAIIVFSVVGTFSVGLVIPKESINLMSAPLDAISVFLNAKGLRFLFPLFSVFLIVGAVGGVTTWVAGPSKSLAQAFKGCQVPEWVTKENDRGVPIGILLFQGVIVTLLSSLFIFMPSLNTAFWLLTAMASQLYLIAYLMLFAAAIRLRYKRPEVERAYKVAKTNRGMWLIAGTGMVFSFLSIFIGFIPPEGFETGSKLGYIALTVFGIDLFALVPLLIKKRKPVPATN